MTNRWMRDVETIGSDTKKSIHPVDVFKDWLWKKVKLFVAGCMIFLLGYLTGNLL